MNPAFVLCAYFAMVVSPCIVAQWGDLLNPRWIFALARRRRTHRQESFLASFRHERYAMAVALEAAFATAEYIEAPRPFLVPKRVQPVETPAFLEARQRVAARLAQMAVAQKLRDAAAAEEKIVTIPADVPVAEVPAVLAAAAELELAGLHLRPRKPQASAPTRLVPAIAAQTSAIHGFDEVPVRERVLAEVVAIGPPRGGPEPLPPSPTRKPGESDDMVVAA